MNSPDPNKCHEQHPTLFFAVGMNKNDFPIPNSLKLMSMLSPWSSKISNSSGVNCCFLVFSPHQSSDQASPFRQLQASPFKPIPSSFFHSTCEESIEENSMK